MSATMVRAPSMRKWWATERQESAASVSASMIAERNAELVAHPLDEVLAVGRLAHRRGGDRSDAAHAAALADHPHAGEAGHGAFHGGVVEVSGGGDALGQAGLVLHLVDHGEAGAGIVLGDEETDGVGAYVEGGQALAPGGTGAASAASDSGRVARVSSFTPEPCAGRSRGALRRDPRRDA